MTDWPKGPEITDPLDEWIVTLAGGLELRIWAHGFRDQDGVVKFTVLARGTPHFEVAIAEIASGQVVTVLSA